MNKPERFVKGLGEASLRVQDLDAMRRFYEEVVGLEVMRLEAGFVFFRVADGYGGHPQVIGLFTADNKDFKDRSVEVSAEATTLHHLAFNVALDDFESERRRLEARGLKVEATTHAWLHVRSLYFPDPEGNLLEFVARDDSVQ